MGSTCFMPSDKCGAAQHFPLKYSGEDQVSDNGYGPPQNSR